MYVTIVRVAVLLVLLLPFMMLLVGPWPVYRDTQYEEQSYFQDALNTIEQQASKPRVCRPLYAGWATHDMTPEIGTPMAGHVDRSNRKRSTGIHAPLYVKALALGDGDKTVVIVSADILHTLPNLIERIAERVATKIPVTGDMLHYHATHTHCGPGGFVPGLLNGFVYGAYDVRHLDSLADVFVLAIVDAYNNMMPARFAHGQVEAQYYIINRVRIAGTDPVLHYAVFENEALERCIVMRYSAHATIFSAEMLEFSPDYPGVMQREVEASTNATAIFLAGATGSMAPRWVDPMPLDEAVQFVGSGLANLLIPEVSGDLCFADEAIMSSMTATFETPPLQIRPRSPNWRVSPVLTRLAGLKPQGRLQALRINDMLLVGFPYEVSGETSMEWQEWARRDDVTLWVTSNSGAFLGYLSPDRYYNDMDETGRLPYETGIMGWTGPHTEAYITRLLQHAYGQLMQGSPQQ